MKRPPKALAAIEQSWFLLHTNSRCCYLLTRYTILAEGSLRIGSAQLSDSGRYYCTASNPAGSDHHGTDVRVFGTGNTTFHHLWEWLFLLYNYHFLVSKWFSLNFNLKACCENFCYLIPIYRLWCPTYSSFRVEGMSQGLICHLNVI